MWGREQRGLNSIDRDAISKWRIVISTLKDYVGHKDCTRYDGCTGHENCAYYDGCVGHKDCARNNSYASHQDCARHDSCAGHKDHACYEKCCVGHKDYTGYERWERHETRTSTGGFFQRPQYLWLRQRTSLCFTRSHLQDPHPPLIILVLDPAPKRASPQRALSAGKRPRSKSGWG